LAYHDVPWREPALIAELLRRPWDVRGPLARLTGFLMRRPDPASILAKSFANVPPPEAADKTLARTLAVRAQRSPEADSGADAPTSPSVTPPFA
jgi:hypothetical protein